jgi:hypothetical protein
MEFHVISFDQPWPPHYGGVIDVYFRLQAFVKAGAQIHLHYFHSGNILPVPEELKLASLHTYPRQKGLAKAVSSVPYMVATRQSSAQLQRLLQDQLPVWYEGLHCTGTLLVLRKLQPHRQLWVRVHNHEPSYYAELAKAERNPVKKIFFMREQSKLKRYEAQTLPYADGLACIATNEVELYRKLNPNTQWLPAFIPGIERVNNDSDQQTSPFSNQKKWLLFHANFKVRLNLKAAQWLVQELLPHLTADYGILLAGQSLPKSWPTNAQLRCVPNPASMDTIIDHAFAVLLPIEQQAGVPLKLLSSLARHKMMISSPAALAGSGLAGLIPEATTANDYLHWLSNDAQSLREWNWTRCFDQFHRLYDNQQNALQIMQLLHTSAVE